MRVNCSFDDEFIKIIDENSKRLHLSRSSMISMLCAIALLFPNGITTLKDKKQILTFLDNILGDNNELFS